jgi:hypothetical protein
VLLVALYTRQVLGASGGNPRDDKKQPRYSEGGTRSRRVANIFRTVSTITGNSK